MNSFVNHSQVHLDEGHGIHDNLVSSEKWFYPTRVVDLHIRRLSNVNLHWWALNCSIIIVTASWCTDYTPPFRIIRLANALKWLSCVAGRFRARTVWIVPLSCHFVVFSFWVLWAPLNEIQLHRERAWLICVRIQRKSPLRKRLKSWREFLVWFVRRKNWHNFFFTKRAD